MARFSYQVIIEAVPAARTAEGGPLRFTAENHDDLFAIAQALRTRRVVDPADSDAFAVGLKLFTEVMLKQRANLLFAPLVQPMREFISRIKASTVEVE